MRQPASHLAEPDADRPGARGRTTVPFAASLWAATSAPLPPATALDGTVRTDVAIVGGGMLGLSLALHLAAAGAGAVVLEAQQVGFGASGRNTGFVVPSFTAGHGPASVASLLGAEMGDRLARLVGCSAQTVFDAIRRFGIACDAEQTGWLQPAHTPAKLALLAARVREWQAFGQPVELLDRRETMRLTGSRRYLGALLDRSGGQLNPLAYARGLARAAIAEGATIFGDSPVLRYERTDQGWRVHTAAGHVSARRVFFTTNALAGSLIAPVTRSIVPARPYQVATQPLDAATLARVLPERQPVADLHGHTFAYRLSADNRLVSGGLALVNDAGAVRRMGDYFIRRLHRYLPDLPPLQPAYAWRGVVATTPDFLPALWQIDDGLFAPIGCNGRGVAVSTALGQAIAGYVATGAALPLPITAARPRALHGLLRFGPQAWLAWHRWRDWRDDRRAGGRAERRVS